MKQMGTGFAVFALFAMCVGGIVFVNPTFAGSGDNFLSSAESNSIWVLNKSTRKMIFVQFKKTDRVWKSNQITVPANYNLDRSELRAVGSRGTSVFLFDKDTGLTTLYSVNKDRSVARYPLVDVQQDLR